MPTRVWVRAGSRSVCPRYRLHLRSQVFSPKHKSGDEEALRGALAAESCVRGALAAESCVRGALAAESCVRGALAAESCVRGALAAESCVRAHEMYPCDSNFVVHDSWTLEFANVHLVSMCEETIELHATPNVRAHTAKPADTNHHDTWTHAGGSSTLRPLTAWRSTRGPS